MEDAPDRAKVGDSSSARIEDCLTNLTNFSMIAEPLLMAPKKYIGDVVNKGAEAPEQYFLPVEVRKLSSTAGGLMPAGTVSTSTMRAIFAPPLFSWSLGEETKERSGRTNFN